MDCFVYGTGSSHLSSRIKMMALELFNPLPATDVALPVPTEGSMTGSSSTIRDDFQIMFELKMK